MSMQVSPIIDWATSVGLPELLPILPGPLLSPLSGKYASPGDLKLFNPVNLLGWDTLRDSLSADYAVYEAPWDWRMPVIQPDGSYIAWREYLKPIIKWAKRATGYPKVDVVAHSMGGTLVRAYIESAEYEDDIGKFAMVGTPNEGSAQAYYLWYGGDPSHDLVYRLVSQFNYDVWESPKKWSDTSDFERLSFYQGRIKSLEELLPVYSYAISCGGGLAMPYPGHTANPLYKLDTGSFTNYDKQCSTPARVCSKVFYSTQEATLMTIQVDPRSASSVYPHGQPVGEDNGQGDGTVLHGSAWMISFEKPFPSEPFADGGKHMGLIGKLSPQITEFLTGQKIQTAGGEQKPHGLEPDSGSLSKHLAISVLGRDRLWVIDPDSTGAGISPITDSFTNGWPSTAADLSAYGSVLDRNDAPCGLFQGSIKGFPGETVTLGVQLFQTNQYSLTNASWIVTTNDITFGIVLNAVASNALTLIVAAPAPLNVASFLSNGTCHVSWSNAPGSAARYRIYARREDESLFQPLGTTTNLSYDTGCVWEQGKTGTNWFFAVVTVTTNNTESPYADIVMNATPVKAAFAADVRSGTPPMTVAFTNQSLGGITNWSWDFDSDGTADSTEMNPTVTYAEPGEYTVTLSVSGLDGTDTKVAVGYITVTLLAFRNVSVLPDRTVEFEVVAQAGHEYLIQSSADLANWSTLANSMATNSISIFRDTNAPSSDKRFYRLAVP
jgi:PKD repeat protein